MKKIYLLSISLFAFLLSFSQSERMVLVEHFTNASCGPCAAYNPGVQAILDDPQNAGRLTSIKYQWYFPGYDPMHDHNPNEANNRTSYYGINGVPTTNIGGDYWQDNASLFSQSHVDAMKALTSPLEIDLTHEFNDNMDEITVNMKIKATGNLPANLKSHIVVIEREINFNSAPGTNGERDFYNVMKKMLPNNNGTTLPAGFNLGDSTELSFSWKLKNIYDYNQLAVVGFVQNTTNQNILQAGLSDAYNFVPQHTNNLQAIEIKDVPEFNCSGKIQPSFTFRNAGSANVTSAEFEYSINNGTPKTATWTGSLDFDEQAEVFLSEEVFNIDPSNEFKIYVNSVNSMPDNFATGDTMITTFSEAEIFNAKINLNMFSGSNGGLIDWKVNNSSGTEVAFGRFYDANTIYNTEFYLYENDCYELIFEHPDNTFTGYANFTDEDNNSVLNITGGDDLNVKKMFNIDPNTIDGINQNINDIKIFPNPSKGNIYINNAELNSSYEITSITGSTVKSGLILNNNFEVNLNVEPGVYFIKINQENTIVEKIIIE